MPLILESPPWFSPVSVSLNDKLTLSAKSDLSQAITKLVNLPQFEHYREALSVSVEWSAERKQVAVTFYDAEGNPIKPVISSLEHPLVQAMRNEDMLAAVPRLYPDQDIPLGLGGEVADVNVSPVGVHVKDTKGDRWKLQANYPKHLVKSKCLLVIPAMAKFRERLQVGDRVVPHVNSELMVVGLEIIHGDSDDVEALAVHEHSASLRIDISKTINHFADVSGEKKPAPGTWVLPDPVFDPDTNQIKIDLSTMPLITPEQRAGKDRVHADWVQAEADKKAKRGTKPRGRKPKVRVPANT